MSHFTDPKSWGKMLTAMSTPFTKEGKVNHKEVERLAVYLVEEQKNEGLVISGTTSESPTLSDEEKLEILEIVLESVGDRASIIFGAGSNSTDHSIYLTQKAEKIGADGIMLVNPYYNRPGQRGLLAHFGAIAKATELGIMLYNIPGRASINLEVTTLLKLIELYPNIKAIKETSGDIQQMSQVCRETPEDFLVYTGDDFMTLPILSLGGYGVVGVITHIVGKETKEMIECFNHSPHKAREIHHRLSSLRAVAFMATNPTPIKYMLSLLGFSMGSVRLPLVEIDDSEKFCALKAMQELKLI